MDRREFLGGVAASFGMSELVLGCEKPSPTSVQVAAIYGRSNLLWCLQNYDGRNDVALRTIILPVGLKPWMVFLSEGRDLRYRLIFDISRYHKQPIVDENQEVPHLYFNKYASKYSAGYTLEVITTDEAKRRLDKVLQK